MLRRTASLLAICSFFLGTWALGSTPTERGGDSVGNGGDTVTQDSVSVSQIQAFVTEARLPLISWIQGLETQIKLDDGLRGRNPRQLPIPLGTDKLFPPEHPALTVYQLLSSMRVEFRTQADCQDATGTHRAGSVLAMSPARICISGYRLASVLNEGNAKIQVEALILHELAHLLGASEDEARSLQKQYMDDMRFVSAESLVRLYETRWQHLDTFASFHARRLIGFRNDWIKLCETVYEARHVLDSFAGRSEVTPVSILNAENRDLAEDLSVRLGQALHLFVCSQNPTRPVPSWLADYERGFGGKDMIEIKEWSRLRGTNGVRATTSKTYIRKIRNEATLIDEILDMETTARFIDRAIASNFLLKLDVRLNETTSP